MADKDDRFRRLRPPTSGDLFAHFGIAIAPAEPARGEASNAPLVAHACPQCGWYVTADDASCFVCGRAEAG